MFLKPKAPIRRAAARIHDELCRAVGQVCDLFTEAERANFFRAADMEVIERNAL